LVFGQRSRGCMALYRHLNEINRVFVLAFGSKPPGMARDRITSTR
jgi:hypothetical protein